MTPEARDAILRELDRHVSVPTRSETLVFKASLDKARAERHSPGLRKIGFGSGIDMLNDGDTLKATYNVRLDYFGNVVESLEAFAKIISDPDVVIDVGVEEVKHGRSVLLALVKQITEVQEVIERRSAREKKARAGLWSRILDWWQW